MRSEFTAHDFPGGIDDLLLQFGQLFGLSPGTATLLLLLRLLRTGIGRFVFAVDLFERADFGEMQIALHTAWTAIGGDILGPEVIGQQLVRLCGERFEVDQVVAALLAPARHRLAQFNLGRLPAGKQIAHPKPLHAKVILHFDGDRKLF